MNERKSKRLRQLVRHLMQQGAVAENGWLTYAPETKFEQIAVISKSTGKYNSGSVTKHNIGGRERTIEMVKCGTDVRLDPACGRAIYQQMKKRAELGQHKKA